MTQARAPVQVGRYLLFRSLKKGGMARVFLGVDPAEPERLVAVKTLLPKLAGERSYREMFATEGRVGVRLDHPHIVRTLESGVDGSTPFIAMELIRGYDLAAVLRQLRKDGHPMPLPLAVGLARDVCDALAYAHELTDEFGQPLNIVNRDVSPGNIMVGFDGRVRLIDFGIAQTTMDVRSQIGSIKGKISYMSPEQVRGLPVDHRTDVFSLGTVLYEMLTGVHVFHAEGDFATMERVRRAEAPPPSAHNPAIDPELDALVGRAMSRELADRYPSARDLLRDLRAYMTRRGMTVTAADLARFMAAMFGPQIAALEQEIEQARRAALDGEPTDTEPAPAADPPMLEAAGDVESSAERAPAPPRDEPPASPEPRPPRRSAVVVVAAVLTVLVGAAWLLLRT